MSNLIQEARKAIPFDKSFDSNCVGRCDECPYKLMELLDWTLKDWESRLVHGDIPTLGDLHTMGTNCQRLYQILEKQGYIDHPPTSCRIKGDEGK